MEGQLGWGDWYFEPTVTVGLIAVAAAYGAAISRGGLRRDDDVTPWFRRRGARPLFFSLGLMVTVLALTSPIDRAGDEFLFAVHMLQHLLLMMVAPPLLLLGIAGAAGLRRCGERAPRMIRAWWGAATGLWAAAGIFGAVVLVWHVPALYDATLTTEPVHVFEHLTFIAAGIVFWWPIVDPFRTAEAATATAISKVAMLTVSGLPPTALGFLFALANRPLYDFYTHVPRLWGLSVLTDQQLAGVLMFGAGNLIYFVAITLIFLRMFGSGEEDERRAQSLRSPQPVSVATDGSACHGGRA